MDTTIDTLTARLDQLETVNRRYRRALCSLLVLIGAAFAFSPASSQATPKKKKDPTFGTVKADRIALMKDGKVRMLLSAKGSKSMISIHGPAGTPRMTLSVDADGSPMMSVNGADKKPRVNFGHSKKHGSHLILFDEAGKVKKKIN